ncbi:MAG: YdjY domain-containing protein [Planctomycetia bacterium]
MPSKKLALRFVGTLFAVVVATTIAPAAEEAKRPAATGVRRLSPTLQVDFDKKRVLLDAVVVFREGPLELLLCPRRTKEHESILAAEVKPDVFHLALLMVGAKPGRPAVFEPFQPPIGQTLRVTAEWTVDGKTQTIDAREWIRDVTDGKAMADEFVFAGSRFNRIPGTDKTVWLGQDGDLVCVANFPGSVVDVARESSKNNASLNFAAWTERIPPRDTPVRLIFEPVGRFEMPPPKTDPPAAADADAGK